MNRMVRILKTKLNGSMMDNMGTAGNGYWCLVSTIWAHFYCSVTKCITHSLSACRRSQY